MRFKPEIAALPPPDGQVLSRDYAQAQNMGEVQLGEEYLFLRRLLGASWLPYGQITRAWLRQEEVKARMCCAAVNFDQFFLVMDCADGQQRRGNVGDKLSGQRCLEHIAARNPQVKIGCVKPAEQREKGTA